MNTIRYYHIDFCDSFEKNPASDTYFSFYWILSIANFSTTKLTLNAVEWHGYYFCIWLSNIVCFSRPNRFGQDLHDVGSRYWIGQERHSPAMLRVSAFLRSYDLANRKCLDLETKKRAVVVRSRTIFSSFKRWLTKPYRELFERVHSIPREVEVQISCSYLQIYMEVSHLHSLSSFISQQKSISMFPRAYRGCYVFFSPFTGSPVVRGKNPPKILWHCVIFCRVKRSDKIQLDSKTMSISFHLFHFHDMLIFCKSLSKIC